MADVVEVTKWNKAMPNVSKADIVRFQLMVHCHIQEVRISSADLECLTLLGLNGKVELTAFCDILTTEGVFKSIQSSRNAITRLQDKELIVKEGKNKKKIFINPVMKIQSVGNILVDIKFFSPQKTLQ